MPNDEKPNTTMPGVVEKIIKPISPDEPEKAQIGIEGADIFTGKFGLKIP